MENYIERAVYSVLNRTGPVGYFKGIKQLVICIEVVLEDESKLQSLRKSVYPIVAEKSDCNAYCVERNLRKIISKIDKAELSNITGINVSDKLTPKILINIFMNYIKFSYITNK